jgi:hypothetical protein
MVRGIAIATIAIVTRDLIFLDSTRLKMRFSDSITRAAISGRTISDGVARGC